MDAESRAQARHVGPAGIVNLVRIQLLKLLLLDEASLVPVPLFGQVLTTSVPHFLHAFVQTLLPLGLLSPEIQDLCISNVHRFVAPTAATKTGIALAEVIVTFAFIRGARNTQVV